ncbi:hypothetical protein DFH29DRAFT_1071523, partial [Suillus ampliporus]
MRQTRAKTTASTPTHKLASSSPAHMSTAPAPATNSSPGRASPRTRSSGPASGESIPAQPRVRTPLTIRLPRASLIGHPSFAANSASAASATASSTAAATAAAAPIPTSSIRSSLPAPAPSPALVTRAPPPTPSNVSEPVSTTPPRPAPPAPTPVTSAPTPTPVTSAPTPTPVSSARLAAPPIYTFPPPPPPPNHANDSAPSTTLRLVSAFPNNAAAAPMSSLSRQSAPNPLLSPALTNVPACTSPRPPTPPPASSHTTLSTPSLAPLHPVHRMQPMVSAAKQARRQAVLDAKAALPSPDSNADLDSDYAADPMDMDVDMESISMMMNGQNKSTVPKTSEKHRQANKKYRQRLKERIKNGEIDEIEAERMKERKRVNARNSRARRKLAMSEAAKDSGSMSSVEPSHLSAPGDFLLCMPDTNPPPGSYYSTTFHEILTRADNRNSGSSEGTSINHPHFELDSANAPALPPIPKSRDLRDACTMTDPSPDSPKENYASLEPIAPALARRPHRQLTPERLREFETNPLELIDKAFLLIVPDPSSSLGKLVLCKVLEHRVSSAGHRFLVQFWGDKKASEMGVERMMEVLCGGYEIDPPPVGAGAGSQG